MIQKLWVLPWIIVVLSLSACRKPDPNPELKDPIYKDLESRAAGYQKAAEEGKVAVSGFREALPKQEANSIDYKNVQRDLAKAEHKLLDDEQWARYYKIRAERRKIMGRIAYREAFDRHEEWPNPSEYSDYMVNIRLREAPRNWNIRVPRLKDRLPSSSSNAKKEKPKAKEEESGGEE